MKFGMHLCYRATAAAVAGPKPKRPRSDVALYYSAGPKRQSVIFRFRFAPTPFIGFLSDFA